MQIDRENKIWRSGKREQYYEHYQIIRSLDFEYNYVELHVVTVLLQADNLDKQIER